MFINNGAYQKTVLLVVPRRAFILKFILSTYSLRVVCETREQHPEMHCASEHGMIMNAAISLVTRMMHTVIHMNTGYVNQGPGYHWQQSIRRVIFDIRKTVIGKLELFVAFCSPLFECINYIFFKNVTI